MVGNGKWETSATTNRYPQSVRAVVTVVSCYRPCNVVLRRKSTSRQGVFPSREANAPVTIGRSAFRRHGASQSILCTRQPTPVAESREFLKGRSSLAMEEVTGLLPFFAGSQSLFVLRLSRKEECRLAFGPTLAWIAARLLMSM